MKIKFLSVMAIMFSMLFMACDDTTDSIGTSLTDTSDLLEITDGTFGVKSSSLLADSVIARNTTGYLGKIRDPETDNYIIGNFMAQFGTLEDYEFPELDSIASLSAEFEPTDDEKTKISKIEADSCHIRLFFTSYYGDSLATMNMTAYELSNPMEEGVTYYSNFDPKAEGYINISDVSKSKVNKTYTLSDLTVSEDEREDAASYTPHIKIDLGADFGTRIMRAYYNDPDGFKNSYNFIHKVCPGFYFEMNDGLGSMAYVTVSQLNVYFRYKNDSTYVGTSTFSGTEEVLQTTNIVNDDALERLKDDMSCTYLKTPAGIFTELELPVDEVKFGHENDTLNTAKLTLTRINNTNNGEYSLNPPSTLLMIPKDSLENFFKNEDVVDYQQSFIATYNSSLNNYVFNNISGLITYMYNNKKDGQASLDWNKAVVIPVTVTTNSSGLIVKVVHDMSLTSTKLVRGTDGSDSPIKLNVIYSKFNQ